MKILTNWSMAGRAAVAAVMLASSAAAVTSCNNANNSLKGNRDTKGDEFVKEKVEIADKTYKPNEVMIDRYIGGAKNSDPERYEEKYPKYKKYFDERGLYGGSVYLQRKEDLERQGFPSDLVAQKADPIEKKYGYEKLYEAEEGESPQIDDFLRARTCYQERYLPEIWKDQEGNFRARYLQELDEDLFLDDEPTWQQCSSYLDRKIAGLDYVSQQDYEKCMKDIKKFEKNQKKTDPETDIAEQLAYKQFKLDSLVFKNLYKEVGLLETIGDRSFYREYCRKGFWGYHQKNPTSPDAPNED